MKKYHLYLWIIALAGLITSCSHDDTDALPADATDANRVTLTASLPAGLMQAKTRALPAAPENHQLRCILEVWSTDDVPVRKKRMETVTATNDKFVFEFEAEPGTYNCLFWADYIKNDATANADGHFTDRYYLTNQREGLQLVIKNNPLISADDAYDAFCGMYKLTKGAAALTNPVIPALTRPLAKLTIKEKNADAYNLCKTIRVRYLSPKAFNVLEGTATAPTSYNYEGAPAGNGTTDLTLFSDYILTSSGDQEIHGEIELTFTKQDNATAELQTVTIPAGIPLKRNYITNAAGSLISEVPLPANTVLLTVDINSEWTTPDEEYNIGPKVGDYYYDDETYSTTLNAAKTCIGIVYEVNADGKSGKIVGLTQEITKWSTETGETGTTNTTDGRANMATISDLIANSGDSKSWDDYPAFKWVTEQNGNADNWDAQNDKWYLPAKDELAALYNAYETYGNDNFNAKLTTASGRKLDDIGYYWSSTERNSDNSWYTSFSGSGTDTSGKIYNLRARCIREF